MLPGVLLLVLFQQLLSQGSHAQAPDEPRGFGGMALGPRSLRLEWSYSSSDWGFLSTGRRFSIRYTANGATNLVGVSENARSLILENLTPYDYSSSSGVLYQVTIRAESSLGTSSEIPFSPGITIPPCPGACNYRYFTTTSCSSPSCVCNPAYTGALCDTPLYLPGDVQSVFANQPSRDTPEVTVTWDQPTPSTLDGRIVSNFNVTLFLLHTNSSSELLSEVYQPNLDGNGRNIRVIGSTMFSMFYMTFNFAVQVTTVTDVPGDTAESAFVNITTHPPGPVRNISIASISDTRVIFIWSPPSDADGLITGYEVTIPGFSPMTSTATLLTVNGLSASTNYTISVTAMNIIGRGQTVNFFAFTTHGPPGSPTDVTATALGPRSVRLNWEFSFSNWPQFSTGRGFVIRYAALGVLPTVFHTVDVRDTARSYLLEGLTPYDYNSSSGVRYHLSIYANTDIRTSNEIIVRPTTTIPRCPGVCNYRYYTIQSSSNCSAATCFCNPAYTGPQCDTPLYPPGNVQATFDEQEEQLMMRWHQPHFTTLDGRVIANFTVQVFIIRTGVRSEIFTMDYAPDPGNDADETNIQVIEDMALSTTFTDFNYVVQVTTVTDVPGDTAESAFVTVATHPPGPVLNLAVSSSRTSLTFSWDPPLDADDLITRYEIMTPGSNLMMSSDTVFTVTGLTAGTSYTVVVRAVNAKGGGQSSSIAASTDANVCLANQYGLFTGTSCSPCPENSVSPARSQALSDCQCIPGYGSVPLGCTSCAMGSYKPDTSNTPCLPCQDTETTTGAAQTTCLCRYTEETDPCYYFDFTPALTRVERSGDPELQTTLDLLVALLGVPGTVTAQERVIMPSTMYSYPVVGTTIACNATGRGVVPAGHSFSFVEFVPAPNDNVLTLQDPGLSGLAEYSCSAMVVAERNTQNIQGPPTQPISVVTLSTAESSTALPAILDVASTSNTSFRVSYSMDPRITDLISNFSFFYRQLNRSIDTEMVLSLPPMPQGVLNIQNLPAGELVLVRFLTSIDGGRPYRSTTHNISLSEEEVVTSTTPPSITTPPSSTTPPSITTLPSITLPSSTTPPSSDSPTPGNILLPPVINNSLSVLVDRTSIRVGWEHVVGAAGYIIYIQAIGDVRTEMVNDGSFTSYLVENLLPNRQYTLQVAAVHEDGRAGPRSFPLSVFTNEAVLGPPTNVVVMEMADLITVMWGRPGTPGVITGYLVTVIDASGEVKNTTVDSATFSAIFMRPAPPYMVRVHAVNEEGVGQSANAVITIEPTTSSSFSLIIPVAAGVGGGLLLVVLILIVAICCCCRTRRNKKGQADLLLSSSTKSNKYHPQPGHIDKRPPAIIPLHNVGSGKAPLSHSFSYSNHGTGTTTFDENYLSPVSSKPQEYLNPEQIDYMPMDGGEAGLVQEEQYAEIPATLTRQPLSETRLIEVKVKNPATPEDYGNEELYMEMERIYFSDNGKANPLGGYEYSREKLEFIEEIGAGEYGRVMKASAKNIVPGQASSIVAVKMLKDDADEKMKKNFLGEATLLAKFGSHPNVMGLLRVVCKSAPQLVIIWYMPHGDLKQYLRKCQNSEASEDRIDTAAQLHISEQVAAGMEYLAGKFFIHRDLAARNVLVGKNNSVKISDFGLSRALAKDDSYYKLSQTLKLPVKWMALESLLYQKFSTYSDVWSFGVLLWEVFSFGATPYKGIKAMLISNHIQMGNRLSYPENCPPAVYQLMKDCWKEVKEQRPTFSQLKLQLKAQSIAARK